MDPLSGASNAVGEDQYLASSRAVNAGTAMCYQHGAAGLCQIGDMRRSLLMMGDDDVVFMTRSLNVTPKTTEQYLIVRSGKFATKVTNNRRVRSRFCTIKANYLY